MTTKEEVKSLLGDLRFGYKTFKSLKFEAEHAELVNRTLNGLEFVRNCMRALHEKLGEVDK